MDIRNIPAGIVTDYKSKFEQKAKTESKLELKIKNEGQIVKTGHGDTVTKSTPQTQTTPHKVVPLKQETLNRETGVKNQGASAVKNLIGIFNQKEKDALKENINSKYKSPSSPLNGSPGIQKRSPEQTLQKEIGRIHIEISKSALHNSPISPQLDKRITQASEKLADQLLACKNPKEQAEVKALQQKLLSCTKEGTDLHKEIRINQKISQGLVDHFAPSELKETLKETVTFLLHEKHGLTDKDISREANLIGKNENAALMKMAGRLILYKSTGMEDQNPSLAKKQEDTGFSPSIIKDCEKLFKVNVTNKPGRPRSSSAISDNRLLLYTNKGVIIQENYLAEGSFKAVHRARSYSQPNSPQQFVTVKPKSGKAHELSVELDKARKSEAPTSEKNGPPPITRPVLTETHDSSDSGASPTTGTESVFSSLVRIPTVKTESAETTGTESVFSSLVRIPTVKTEATTIPQVVVTPAPTRPLPPIPQVVVTPAPPSISPEKWNLSMMKSELARLNKELEKSPPQNKEELMADIATLEHRIKDREEDISIAANLKKTSEAEDYETEIKLTLKFQGPGIVKTHSVVDTDSGEKIMIQEKAGLVYEANELRKNSKTVVTLEDLNKLHQNEKLTETETLQMLKIYQDAFQGINRIHQMGYMHRDIKEENIFVTADGRGALADFGTVTSLTKDPLKDVLMGSAVYMSPEAVALPGTERWNSLSEKCDVWSCAMMLQKLIPGKDLEDHPAFESTRLANFNVVTSRLAKLHDQGYRDYPEPQDPLEHLIWSGTRIDPNQRPTMDEFCKEFQSLIDSAINNPRPE